VLSALVAFPVTRLIYGAKARPWFRWQIVTALTGFVLYLVLILLLPAVLELNFNAAQIGLLGRNITYSNGRFELWTIALEMIVNSPWLGVGPMHYAANPTILYAHPHNAPLQLAAEWGIPVALLVLVLFIWGAVRWVLRSKVSAATEDDGNLRVAVFGALLTSALYSLFDGVIVMPISQIMLVLIIGWMLGLLTPQTMHCKPVARFRQLVLILSFAVVLTGVLRPLFPSVFCLEELQRKYDQANPKAPYLKTRFWQQGILTGYPKTFPCQTN
jgi:O-antigen ligase